MFENMINTLNYETKFFFLPSDEERLGGVLNEFHNPRKISFL